MYVHRDELRPRGGPGRKIERDKCTARQDNYQEIDCQTYKHSSVAYVSPTLLYVNIYKSAISYLELN